MKIKNIQFSDPIRIHPKPIMVGGNTSAVAERKIGVVRMFGQGMVLFSQRPQPITVSLFLQQMQKARYQEPVFFTCVRPVGSRSVRVAAWKDTLQAFIGVKELEASFGIIADFSEGRDGETYIDYLEEIRECAELFSDSIIPCVVQLTVLTPPDVVRDISEMKGVDAIVLSEYMEWNILPKDVRKIFFSREVSPFAGDGGGVVVGKYWIPIALEWMHQVRRSGIRVPLITGGAMNSVDIRKLQEGGVAGMYIGRAVKMLRPWQVPLIQNEIRKLFPRE